MPMINNHGDKMTRDVRQTLRSLGTAPGRYFKGTAKLFLASGSEVIKAGMPGLAGMIDVNKDVIVDASKFLRNPVDAISKSVNKALGGESFQALKKLAHNALDDLQTGNFYDKDRDRSKYGQEVEDLLNNFGGFDMTAFDSNGDYDPSKSKLGMEKAADEAAEQRMGTEIQALGLSTSAITGTLNANAANDVRLGLKRHGQTMNAMQNVTAQQGAILQSVDAGFSSILETMREIHQETQDKLDGILGLLGEIRDGVKPPAPEDREVQGPDFLGGRGELDIRKYLEAVKKNADDRFGISGAISMMTGGRTIAELVDLFGNNPLELIMTPLLERLIPETLKEQMKVTESYIENFIPALMAKLSDRGRRFEEATNDDERNFGDLIAGIFGIKPRILTGVDTSVDDVTTSAAMTVKTVKAIEEVIPAQLSMIYSAISGKELMLFDYRAGKFVSAAATVARETHDANDLAGNMGTAAWNFRNRLGQFKFADPKWDEEFDDYVYEWFNNLAKKGQSIDYNQSREDFMDDMPGRGGARKDAYYDAITATLKEMPRDEFMALNAELYRSRMDQMTRHNQQMRDLRDSGLDIAYGNVMDPALMGKIEDKTKESRYGMWDYDVYEMMDEARLNNVRSGIGLSVGDTATSILNVLQKGIVTFTHIISDNTGKKKDGEQPEGMYEALRGQRTALDIAHRREYARMEAGENKLLWEREAEAERKELKESPDKPMTDAVVGFDTPHEIYRAVQREYSNIMTPAGRSQNQELEMQRKLQGSRQYFVDNAQRLRSKFGIDPNKTFLGNLQGAIGKAPFALVEDSLKAADAAMFKILYGEDAPELKDNEEDAKSVLETVGNAIKTHFIMAKDWFLENVGGPLKEFFFGKEGLFPRLKTTFSEKFLIPLADKAKAFGAKLKTKALGNEVLDERGNGTGVYEGGWFSDQYNRIKAKGTDTLGEVGGIVTGAFEHMLRGDEDDEYGGLIGKFKKAGDSLNQALFGEDANGDDHQSREKFNFLTRELNKALPEMTIGAGIGLITSFFLPGGPLLGIITGMGGGLLNASESLKSYLFGEKFVKEKVVIGSDGNPVMVKDPKTGKMKPKTRVYESRKGAFIDSEIYDGLKQYLPKTGIGAGIGWLVGQGIFPGIGGAIGGALIGSLGGMIASSDRLKRILFGDAEDETGESGLFSKNFRENLLNAFVGHGGGMVIGRIAGGAVGLLAQGILPGGLGIFAHQLFATLGSAVGLISGPKIINWIFGEEQEVEVKDPKTGRKIKKKARMGGLFGKVYDDAKENLINPLAERINAVGHKISTWFNESIVTPFSHAMEPAKQAMRDAADSIRSSIRNIGDRIKESLDNIFDKTIGMPLGDFMREKVIKPLDSAVSRFFSFIGKVIGTVVAAPFKALEFLTTGEVAERSRSEIKRDNRIAKMNEKLQARRNKITAKEMSKKRKEKRADDSVSSMKLLSDVNAKAMRSEPALFAGLKEPEDSTKAKPERKGFRFLKKSDESKKSDKPDLIPRKKEKEQKAKPEKKRRKPVAAMGGEKLSVSRIDSETPKSEPPVESAPDTVEEKSVPPKTKEPLAESERKGKAKAPKLPKVNLSILGKISRTTDEIAKDVHGIKLMLSKVGNIFSFSGKSSGGGRGRGRSHKGIIGTLFGLVGDVVSAGVSIISIPFKALGITAEGVTGVFGSLVKAGTSLLGFVAKTATGTIALIGSTLTDLTGGIVKTITSVLGFIPNTIAGVVNAVSKIVGGAADAAGGIIGGLTKAVGGVIGGTLKTVGGIVKGAVDTITFVPRAILGVAGFAGNVIKTGFDVVTAPVRLLTGGGKRKKEARKAREQGRAEGYQKARVDRQYKSAPSVSSSIISQLPMVKTDYGEAIRVFIAGQVSTEPKMSSEEKKLRKETLKDDRRRLKEQRKDEKRERRARRWAPVKGAVNTALGLGWGIAGGLITQKAQEWLGEKLGLKGTRFWTDVAVPIGFGDNVIKGTTVKPLVPIRIHDTDAIPVYIMGHYGDGKSDVIESEAPINAKADKEEEEKESEDTGKKTMAKSLLDKFSELTDTIKSTGDRVDELIAKLSESRDNANSTPVPGSLEWMNANAQSDKQFNDWVSAKSERLLENNSKEGLKAYPRGSLEWLLGNVGNDTLRAALIDADRIRYKVGEALPINRAATGITNAQAGPSVVGEHGREVIWNDRKPRAKVVGENGPEVVNLEPGDNVIPNHKLPSNMRGDTLKRFASGTDPKLSAAERLKRQAAKSAVDTAGNIGKGVLSVASLPFMGAYGIGKGVASAYKNRTKIATGVRNIGTKVSLGMSSAEEQFINDLKAMQPQVDKDIQPYGEEIDNLVRELREKFIPDNLPDAMNIMDDAKLKATAIGLRYGGIMPDRTGWDTDKQSKFDAIFDYFDRKDAEREARREDMLGAYADDVEKYGWIRATGGRALRGGLKAAMWASFWPMLLPFTMTRKLLTLGKARGKKRMKRLSRKEYKELNAIQKFRYNKNRHGLAVAGGLAGLGAIKHLARPALPLFGAATKIGGSFTKLAGKYIGGAGDKLLDISKNGFGVEGKAGRILDAATWLPRKIGGIYGYGAKGIGAVTGGMGSGMRGLGSMISGEPQRAAKKTLNAAGEATREAIERKAAEVRQSLKDKPVKQRIFSRLHTASEAGKKAGGFFGKFLKRKADGTPGSSWDEYVKRENEIRALEEQLRNSLSDGHDEMAGDNLTNLWDALIGQIDTLEHEQAAARENINGKLETYQKGPGLGGRVGSMLSKLLDGPSGRLNPPEDGDSESADNENESDDRETAIGDLFRRLRISAGEKASGLIGGIRTAWAPQETEGNETQGGGPLGVAKYILSPILGSFNTVGEYLRTIITLLGGEAPDVENPITGKKESKSSKADKENKEEQEKAKKRTLIDNFREFKKKYMDIDRKAERSSDAADEYDKEIAKAQTPEEIEAVQASQQMNVNNGQIEENEEKEKKGGILSTILGGLSGILGLIPGLGSIASAIPGLAGGVVSGATTALPAILGGAKAATGAVAGFSGTAIGGALGLAGTAKAVVTGDLGHAASYGTRTVTGIASKFLSFFAKASTKLLNVPAVENLVVKVLGSGATSGISGAIRNAVGKWVNGAASGSIAALGTKLAKVNIAVMVATAAADVITGMTHASEHFNVLDSEVTEGMRLAAGLAKGLSGLAFGLIPVDWFAQFLWKLFASQEEKDKLTKDQEAYKERVAKFNKENGTNLSVEEFQRDYKEDGTKKTHFVNDTIKAAGGLVVGAVKNTFGGVIGVMGNFAGLAGKFATGDLKGLWQYDLTEHISDDNPLKWLVAPATLVAKIGLLFPTIITWIGKHVLFGVVRTVKNVVMNGIGAVMSIGDISSYVIKGDPLGLLKYDPTERIASDKDALLYPFIHTAFTGVKFGGLVLSIFSMFGHKLAGLVAPVFGGMEDNASVFWTGSSEIFKLAMDGHPLQILGVPTSKGDGSPMGVLFSSLGTLVKILGFAVGIVPALMNMIAKPFEWIGRKLGMITDEYDEDGNIIEKKSLSEKITGWMGKHLGPVGTFVDLMFNGAQTEDQQNASSFSELMAATSARGKVKPELPKPVVDAYGTGPEDNAENIPDLKPLSPSNRKKSVLDRENLVIVGEGIGRGIVSSFGDKAKKIKLADIVGSVGTSMADTFIGDMKRTEGSQATIGSSIAAGTAVAISESPQVVSQTTDSSTSTTTTKSSTIGGKLKTFANRIFGRGKVKPMSQADPRWANESNSMADDGCGPTAAAMVASAYGRGDPGEADRMSRSMGMRAPDGGTNPDFFGKYAKTKGFGMREGPVDGGRIQANLKRGQPVVMMGKGGEFGSGTHYLVADKAEGKSGVGFVDPLTGTHKSTSIESLGRNASTAVYSYGHGPDKAKAESKGDAPDKLDTGRDDEEFGRGNYSTNEKVAAAQKNLWNAMKSKEKTLAYDQSYGKQDPDKGSASCASTVAWAYRKTLGINPGGNAGFALSREQYKDSNFTRIYERKKGGPDPDLSKLQVGDIVYFKYNTPYFQPNSAKSLDHTEMYGGDGQDWSHGGSTAKNATPKDSKGHQKGPKLYTVSASRKKSIMVINRYTPFMTGEGINSVDASAGASSTPAENSSTATADNATTSATAASTASSEAETKTYESPLDFIRDLIGNVVSPIKSAFVEALGGKSSDGNADGSSVSDTSSSVSTTATADTGSTSAGETAATTGSAASATATNKGKFPTYNLNERQLKGIANILGHEQGDQAGWEAEASLLANMVDQSGDKNATVKRLTEKAQSGWFYQGKQRFNNPGAAKPGPIAAARSVLVQGYRTLPRYVNEHDMLGTSKVSDIGSVSNDGKTFNKFDRSKYIPNKTIIKQDPNRFKGGGIKYTFYTFPSAKSDPFGYTSEAMRKKWGDDHYEVSTKRAAGKGPGDTEKTDKDTLAMMARENDREPPEFGRGPEDSNQTSSAGSPQQALVDRMKSISGTIKYSTKNPVQDPDKGTASCASTVGWAYRKALGVKGMSASSTEQSKDSRFTTIYENKGNGLVDPAILRPGDVMYYHWDRTALGKDRIVKHTEMYAGNNQDWSHGGPDKGPVIKNLNDYRRKRLMIVRRYTPFLNGQDVQVNQPNGTTETTSTAEVDASGNTGSEAESPMDIIRDLMSKIKVGISQQLTGMFNGGGVSAAPVSEVPEASADVQPMSAAETVQETPAADTTLGRGSRAKPLRQNWGLGTADTSRSAESVGDMIRRINSDITSSRKAVESELDKESVADKITKAMETVASQSSGGSGTSDAVLAGISAALTQVVQTLKTIEGYAKIMSETPKVGESASEINARYSGKTPDSPRYPNGYKQLDDRGADIVRRLSMNY